MLLKHLFLSPLLNNNLPAYKISGWQLFSFSTWRMLLRCLVATIVAENKSLSAYWLLIFFIFYFFVFLVSFSLVAFRLFFITGDLHFHCCVSCSVQRVSFPSKDTRLLQLWNSQVLSRQILLFPHCLCPLGTSLG